MNSPDSRNVVTAQVVDELPVGTGVCPSCGCPSIRRGVPPWYLGTIGLLVVRPAICNQCGCKFDLRKPGVDYGRRLLSMGLLINGIGCAGILAVLGALAAFAMSLN